MMQNLPLKRLLDGVQIETETGYMGLIARRKTTTYFSTQYFWWTDFWNI
jgi:hypothetical protein